MTTTAQPQPTSKDIPGKLVWRLAVYNAANAASGGCGGIQREWVLIDKANPFPEIARLRAKPRSPLQAKLHPLGANQGGPWIDLPPHWKPAEAKKHIIREYKMALFRHRAEQNEKI